MNFSAGASFVSFAADLNPLRRDFQTAQRETEQAAQQVERAWSNAFTRAFSGVSQHISGVRSALGDLVRQAAAFTLGNLATQGINQIQNLVTGVVRGGVAFNAFKEQASVAFTTLLKSGQAAQTMITGLWDFGSHTPFSFEPVTQAAQRLIAMGFAAKDVLPELKNIGNAVAGLGGGEDVFNRVTLAIGQMQSKGKAAGDEMLQLTEAGIPAWKYLAAAIGTDIPTAMKLVSKGAIDSGTAIRALNAGIERDFAGMADAQSRTWSGLLNTMGDLWKQFTGTVLAQGFERARAGLVTLTTLLDSPAFKAFGERLGAGIGNTLDVIGDALRTIAPAARATFDGFRDLAGLLLGPFAGGLGSGAERLNTFRAIVQLTADSVVTFIQAIRGDWAGQATASINPIVRAFGVLGQDVRQLATNIPQWLNQAWSGLVAGAQSALGALGGIWDRTLRPLADGALIWGRNIVVQLANGIVAGVGAVVQALGYIGGIITSWLQPHSPPKLLPDLVNWGAQAATLYMQGWTKGDFSAFDDLSGQLEGLIRSLADVGQIPQEGIIPLVLTGRTDLAWIQEMIRTTGTVTKAWLDKLVADAGPAGEAMRALVQDYADVARAQKDVDAAQSKSDEATRKVAAAQRDLNAITREYAGVLGPLQDQLDALTEQQQQLSDAQRSNSLADQLADSADPVVQRLAQIAQERQALDDAQRAAELNKTIAESDDPVKVAQARLELERLTLEAQRRQVEGQRAARDADLKRQQLELQIQESRTKQAIDGVKEEERAATAAARARLDQAKTEQEAAQDTLQAMQETLGVAKNRYDAQRALIAEQEKSNSLVAEQTRLLEAQAKAAEAAAQAAVPKGGAAGTGLPKGAAGGAGSIPFGLPAGGLVPPVPGGGFVPPTPATFVPPTLPPLVIPWTLGGPRSAQPTGSGVGLTQGGAGDWGQASGGGGGPFDGLIASLDEVKAKFATVQAAIATEWGRLTPVFDTVKGALTGYLGVLKEVYGLLSNPAAGAATVGRNVGAVLGGAAGFGLLGPAGIPAGAILGGAGGAAAGPAVANAARSTQQFFAPTPVPPTPTFGPTPGVGGPGKSPFEGLIPDGLDAAIHGLIDGVTTLGDAIRSGLVGAFTVFKGILGPVMDDLKSTGPQWVQIGQDLVAIWGAVSPILETVAKVIGGALVVAIGIAVSTVAGLVEGFSKALPGALQFFHGQLQVALGVINFFKDEVIGIFTLLKDVVTGHWGRLGTDLLGMWTKLVGDLGQITDGLKNMVEGAFLALVGAVGGYVEGFVKTLYGFFDQIYKDATGKTTSLKDEVELKWTTLSTSVISTVGNLFTTVGTKADNFKTAIVTTFQGVTSGIGNAFSGLGTLIVTPLNVAIGKINDFGSRVADVMNNIAEMLHAGRPFKFAALPQIATPGQQGGGQGDASGGPAIQGLATGTKDWRGGWAIVGEQGPELVKLPQHAVVIPNGMTNTLLAAGVPGFVGGLNIPVIGGIIDLFKGGADAIAAKAMASIGVPDLGPLTAITPQIIGQVKEWVVARLKKFITDMVPVGPEAVQRMYAAADSQVGLPYLWGGGHGIGGPGVGFDCSGFVAWVLDQGGIPNPHGIVTAFAEWMTQTGGTPNPILGIGVNDPYAAPDVQHIGMNILGTQFESGGPFGGVGRNGTHFGQWGIPPGSTALTTAKAGGGADATWNAILSGQVAGQFSAGHAPPLASLGTFLASHPSLLTKDSLARLADALPRNPLVSMAGGGVLDEPVYGIGAESGVRYLLGEAGREFVIPADVLPKVAAYFAQVIATGDAEGGLVGVPLDMRDPLRRLARDYLLNGIRGDHLPQGTTTRPPLYGGQALTQAVSARARGRGIDTAGRGGGGTGPGAGLPPIPGGAGGAGGGSSAAGGPTGRLDVTVHGELVARWPDGKQTVTTITSDPAAFDTLVDEVIDETADRLDRLPPQIR